MKGIVVFDFAGTLVKPEIVGEANEFRAKILERELPTKEEHAKPEMLYRKNREFVEKLTGLKREMKILCRDNNKKFTEVSEQKYLNQISTDLFRIGMFKAAKKYGSEIFVQGIIDVLKKLNDSGYKIAIVSGVRNDIISGVLQIAGLDFVDYIYGQPFVLGISNKENLDELKKKGDIKFLIGDKLDDVEPAKEIDAKSVFVKWGHSTEKEEDIADFAISEPKKLLDIIK